MRRTEWLQETRRMRFEEAYGAWSERRLAQEEAPQLLGVCERLFRTLQDRLPKEMELAGITDMQGANQFLTKRFWPAFNRRFKVCAAESGSAFVPLLGVSLDDILCLKAERTVRGDNCVSYQGKVLQIPKIKGRCHYVKATVQVHEYSDGHMAIFHGPRKLASYETTGELTVRASRQEVGDAA